VAQRPVAGPGSITIGEFDRAVNELFEDLLISRWRERGVAAHKDALVAEGDAHYEVRINAGPIDPRVIEVEVGERRLRVRIPGRIGLSERSFDFSHPVDPDGVTARLVGGTLLVALPKKRGRKIKVE
jgi:HSP20 family molecular chaperone IbpA